MLGPIEYRRAYYYCADCGTGVAPRDEELGVAHASLTPGLAAMVDRVGAAVPFAKGRDLLAELAGVELSTKRVERGAEADGKAQAAAIDIHAAAVATGEVVPLGPASPVAKLYIAVDGTGIPAVPGDTAGRKGKGPDGQAHTREVKLGVVFTQTTVDNEGFPIRDPESSSYVSTLEPVEHFGALIYAEARRRGSAKATEMVVLGDGAVWIWNLAKAHFPKSDSHRRPLPRKRTPWRPRKAARPRTRRGPGQLARREERRARRRRHPGDPHRNEGTRCPRQQDQTDRHSTGVLPQQRRPDGLQDVSRCWALRRIRHGRSRMQGRGRPTA